MQSAAYVCALSAVSRSVPQSPQISNLATKEPFPCIENSTDGAVEEAERVFPLPREYRGKRLAIAARVDRHEFSRWLADELLLRQ